MNNNEEKESTSITLQNCYGEYTIKINDTDMDISSVLINLVVPVLLAAGYHRNSVKEYIEVEI